MAYTKHNWQDYEAGGTLVTAQKLNEMEDGIETANEMLHVDVDEELSETSDNPVANNVLARTFRRITEAVNSIIQNAVTVVDTSLSTTSTNPVQNKVVTAAISQAGGGFRVEIVSTLPATGQNGVMYLLAVEQTETGNLYDEYLWIESQSRFERVGSRISVDDALSSTSENPVQNKVVKSAIDGKQDYIAPVVIAQDGTKSLVVNGNLATSANVNVMNGTNTVALQSSSLDNIVFTDGTTANRYSVQDLVDREDGVQSDWDEDDEESLAYIQNKPKVSSDGAHTTTISDGKVVVNGHYGDDEGSIQIIGDSVTIYGKTSLSLTSREDVYLTNANITNVEISGDFNAPCISSQNDEHNNIIDIGNGATSIYFNNIGFGNTDISEIGDGTITGIIDYLDGDMQTKADAKVITDQYSATKQYSVGDYCIYNNTLYKCKVTATGQLPTNTTYWKLTSVGGELGSVNTNIPIDYTSSVRAWSGDTLKFTLPKENGYIYELIARKSYVNNSLVHIYFTIRSDNIIYKDNAGNLDATLSYDGSILTVALPGSTHWIYSMKKLITHI